MKLLNYWEGVIPSPILNNYKMATKHEYRVGDDILVIDNDGNFFQSSTETIAAGGGTTAVDLTKYYHDVDADVGGDIFTVANGTIGQSILFVAASATGTISIQPATFIGGTSVRLQITGDTVELYYTVSGWVVVGGNNYTVIA